MTTRDPETTRANAEERLRKREESEAAAKVVRAEVEAKKVAAQVNTARLRALRMEKEAADRARAAELRAITKPSARSRDPHAAPGKGAPGQRGNPQR